MIKLIEEVFAIHKEQTIQVGNREIFNRAIERLGVEKREELPGIQGLLGLKVFQSSIVPANEAWFVDRDGKILKRYKIQ